MVLNLVGLGWMRNHRTPCCVLGIIWKDPIRLYEFLLGDGSVVHKEIIATDIESYNLINTNKMKIVCIISDYTTEMKMGSWGRKRKLKHMWGLVSWPPICFYKK